MKRTFPSLLGVLALAGLLQLHGSASPADAATGATGTPIAGTEPAARLVGSALIGGGAYRYVRSLSDEVGARLCGSPGAERAVEWALRAMREAGLKNVRREAVRVPHWVRGEESAEIVAPVAQPIKVTALGRSVATPPAGLEGEVVEAGSFEALAQLGERARGRIIFLNQPMARTTDFTGYSAAVPLRSGGALAAARAGALAVLVRSVGTGLHRLPHTGAVRYQQELPQLPAAAISIEDAELLHRLLESRAPVRLRLRLGARLDGEVESANVVGEVPGRERPDEIVLIGAHLDSWDLGTGALDDAAGCGIVLDTGRMLTATGLRPRRTVRVVLFMNEEMGLSGADAYAAAHKAELARHVAALEADSGAGAPTGYRIVGGPAARQLLGRWVQPLARLVPPRVSETEIAGADLIPLQVAGVPVFSVEQDVSDYFEWHHTAGDTLDKVSPRDLALTTAAVAALTFAAADAPADEKLPPSPPPPKH